MNVKRDIAVGYAYPLGTDKCAFCDNKGMWEVIYKSLLGIFVHVDYMYVGTADRTTKVWA